MIVFIILFGLLFVPINLKFKVFYDLFNNTGNFKFLLFNKIKLINVNLRLINNNIEVTTKKGKKILLPLSCFDANLEFYNQLQKALFKRLIVKRFYLTINVGVSENAFLSSMISGYIQVFLSIILSYFSYKSGEFKPITKIKTHYNEERLNARLKGQINISTIGLFLSIIRAWIKKTQKAKKESYVYGR